MRSAVLFVVFNRPDVTRQVFEAIRAARPPRLYVAADGPRRDRAGEAERCAEVRRIATDVDWDCSVRILFRDENLGCKLAVSGAIDWFFGQEEEGIVLEDDVLPVPSFFTYCDELLERYRTDVRIGLVSGCNPISSRAQPSASYFFSRSPHIWGWASWRRAWQTYDVAMKDWPQWRDSGGLTLVSNGCRRFERYWRGRFDVTHSGQIDTWDYQWAYALWRRGMLSILPASNLTHNLGFGADATHTTLHVPDYVTDSPPRDLDFPLKHPSRLGAQDNLDRLIDLHVYYLTLAWATRQALLDLPVLGTAIRAFKHAFRQK